MLNNIVSTYKIKGSSCKFPKYTYLCNVFFIVLDLRLTKVGARRCSFFYVCTSRKKDGAAEYIHILRAKGA